MALSEKQMNHPRYWTLEANSQDALSTLLRRSGLTRKDILPRHEAQAGRLIDDMVALMLRVTNDSEAR